MLCRLLLVYLGLIAVYFIKCLLFKFDYDVMAASSPILAKIQSYISRVLCTMSLLHGHFPACTGVCVCVGVYTCAHTRALRQTGNELTQGGVWKLVI